MFLDIPFISDIITLTQSQQALVDNCLVKENVHQISNDYKVHDQVLKTSILSSSDKLQPFFIGPHTIEQAHIP